MAWETSHASLNDFIGKPVGDIRIATFNVHFFRDALGKRCTVEDLLRNIGRIEADVFLFQEIPNGSQRMPLEWIAFSKGLKEAGYSSIHYGAAGNTSLLGNMIASKWPLENCGMQHLGWDRIIIWSDVLIPIPHGHQTRKKIRVFCTHWQNANPAARLTQAKATSAKIKNDPWVPWIIGADFNATIDSEAIKELVGRAGAKEAFSSLGWNPPVYTCWSGGRIDHLFLDPKVRVNASYVYHTASSDHLPIIADLSLGEG